MHFFTKPRLISWFLLSMIAGALFFSYMSGPRQERTLLYFQRYNGELGVEERYIPTLPGQDLAVTLVHELLLGPADRDFLHLTDPEVQPRSCFVRGNALYVDLPAHALTPHTPSIRCFKKILRQIAKTSPVFICISTEPPHTQNIPAHSSREKTRAVPIRERSHSPVLLQISNL